MQSTGLAYVFHNGGGGLLGGHAAQHRPDPRLHRPPGAADRAHHDRRHRRGHVARRAHHPAGHRPGHVGADLHQRGVGHAQPGRCPAEGEAGWPKFSFIIALALVFLVAIVFIEQGQRRIPVTFAKRVVGRRMYGGQSTYIPMKVNTGGVVPIIFASSVLYFPILISNVFPSTGWEGRPDLDQHAPGAAEQLWYYRVPLRRADPGLRLLLRRHHLRPPPAGRGHPQTGRLHPRHPARVPRPSATCRTSSTGSPCPGALFLALIALLPSILLAFWNIQNYPFAGTTLLIAVGVALETMKQVDSQLMLRNYEGS